jgi:hypothetical protein
VHRHASRDRRIVRLKGLAFRSAALVNSSALAVAAEGRGAAVSRREPQRFLAFDF